MMSYKIETGTNSHPHIGTSNAQLHSRVGLLGSGLSNLDLLWRFFVLENKLETRTVNPLERMEGNLLRIWMNII